MINSSFRSIICQLKPEVSPYILFTNKSIFELNSIISTTSTFPRIHYSPPLHRNQYSTTTHEIRKLTENSNFKPQFLNSKIHCIIKPALDNIAEMENKQQQLKALNNGQKQLNKERLKRDITEISTYNTSLPSENQMSVEIIRPLERRQKRKKDDPSIASIIKINRDIMMAAKQNDKKAAFKLFKMAVESKIKIYSNSLDTLLYMMTGGADWIKMTEISCQNGKTEITNKEEEKNLIEEIEEIKEIKDILLNIIDNEYIDKSEIMYLSQARLLACVGDLDGSLQCSKKAVLEGMQPKVRQFVPALVGYAVTGDTEGAMRIERLLKEYDLELTELEFKLLFKAFMQSGAYEDFERLLKRVGEERAEISEECFYYIKARFDHENKIKEKWKIKDAKVDQKGYSAEANGSLNIRDIQERDWDIFIKGVERLALEQEIKGNEFQKFIQWYNEHGPFDIIIDGANVALFGHSKELDFNIEQLEMAYQKIKEKYKKKKILLILHTNRVKREGSKTISRRDFINKLIKYNRLYETPKGSNDDWYWLYAAISAKEKGFLVTNDLCRDHIFQLLSPKYVYKWRNNQVINFSFVVDDAGSVGFKLLAPATYTTCVQKLENGNWMVPVLSEDSDEGIDWKCIKAVN